MRRRSSRFRSKADDVINNESSQRRSSFRQRTASGGAVSISVEHKLEQPDQREGVTGANSSIGWSSDLLYLATLRLFFSEHFFLSLCFYSFVVTHAGFQAAATKLSLGASIGLRLVLGAVGVS